MDNEAPPPDWFGQGPCGRAERRLAMLEHVAGVGVRLADAFAVQAFAAANTAWVTPDSHVDPGIPFAGMARVVRQTLALQGRFEKEERLAAVAEANRRDPDRRARHVKRRRLIKDAVTEVIKDAADPSDAERLFRDLEERLHDEEADERFDDGPVGQVVARICRALGISVDLSLFDEGGAPAGQFETPQRSEGRAAPSPQPPITRPPAPGSSAPEPPAPRPPAAKPPVSRWADGPRIPGVMLSGKPDPRQGDPKPPPGRIDPLPD